MKKTVTMKELQRLLWLAGLLVGTSNIAAAQNNYKQISEDRPNSTLKVKTSIEVRAAYDFKNYYAEPAFGPAIIPMESDPNNGKRFLFDIPSAVLTIEKELPAVLGEDAIKMVIQTSLKKELALKNAYVDFKGFRIGKAASNFGDPDACGLVGGGFPQVRWQHKLNTLFGFAAAIEEAPDLVIYPADPANKPPLRPYKSIPAVSANVRYEREKLWHVQVSGLFRVLEYRNTNDKVNIYMPTWGVNMGASLHLVPEQTTLRLQGVYGQGIGSYVADLQDLAKEDITVYTTRTEESAGKTLDAWGLAMGAAHKWLPKLRSEARYQVVYTTDSERGNDAYQYGQTASIDLFYHPTEQVKIGTEYQLAVRKNIKSNPKDAHRIQVVVGFEL